MNYAKFALQPFGSLLLAKDFADMISRPRFEPVIFDPETVKLTAASEKYIEKLSEMLLDRPELQITVCGIATRLDVPEEPEESHESEASEGTEDPEGAGEESSEGEMNEQDKEEPGEASEPVLTPMGLAEERGHAVRKAIVATGVHDERILSCAPDVLDDDSDPRVEISL
jgi:outer membrane protein OmpA-like peptidoglycan-associated protein